MKSSSSGGHRDDDDDAEDGFEPRQEVPRPPAKSDKPGELDDFDEEDFDDEFDDDFEEELEDEYELSEFGELTEDDLTEDEEADVTAMGDFVDEDAEPEEPPLEEAEGAEAETEEGGKKKKKSKKKAADDPDED